MKTTIRQETFGVLYSAKSRGLIREDEIAFVDRCFHEADFYAKNPESKMLEGWLDREAAMSEIIKRASL